MTLAVSCPACGAGIKALGGGRVVIHACAHCGSTLDAVENFRLIARHANLRRPDTPFALGQKGRIAGVDWVVIGTLAWAETYRNITWTWVDHQLYSPSHGYAWLTLEDGHLIFTRRHRGPFSRWVTPAAVEAAEQPPIFIVKGQSHRYYETTTARVTFAEGEFSWAVQVGDKVTTVSFLADQSMVSLGQDGRELEVEISTYPPQAETWAAFGLPAPRPWRVHPLQPLQAWRHESFLTAVGALGLAASLVMGMLLLSQGSPVKPVYLSQGLPIEARLPITRTDGLVTIRLSANLYNAWAGIEAEVTDPEGEVVFDLAREMGYYAGVEDGESWSEGSQSMTVTFRAQQVGDHLLTVAVPEGGTGEGAGGPPIDSMVLTVGEGRAATFWLWLTALLFAPFAGITWLRRYLHRKARWRGSDWSDD